MLKYEQAVKLLNSLQSNAKVISSVIHDQDRGAAERLAEFTKFARRCNISLADIDKLNVIHISGTKGKGSVCAMCESILRHNGFKTGFFSSPHMVEVRERIRINGHPLSRTAFAGHFSYIYDLLDCTKTAADETMPFYFRFLTLMAFRVFLQEQVDVAVIECGLGGTFDCTNCIQKPMVCGITRIDFDHMEVLGDTLLKIAQQKAGIIKHDVPVITYADQPNGVVELFRATAERLSAPFYIVAEKLGSTDSAGRPISLGIDGDKQRNNAALAVALCKLWLFRYNRLRTVGTETFGDDCGFDESASVLSESFLLGLKNVKWPGRYQKVDKTLSSCPNNTHAGVVTYYLEGAHTPHSMTSCVEWFLKASAAERLTHLGNSLPSADHSLLGYRQRKALIFNVIGARQAETLLAPLREIDFDVVIFCPNVPSLSRDSADVSVRFVDADAMFAKCEQNRDTWLSKVRPGFPADRAVLCHSVEEAVSWLELFAFNGEQQFASLNHSNDVNKNACGVHIHVLVTGSLHLVGATLQVLQIELDDSANQCT